MGGSIHCPRMRAACFSPDARAAWSGGDLRRPQPTVARHICVVLTTALAERSARNEQPQAQKRCRVACRRALARVTRRLESRLGRLFAMDSTWQLAGCFLPFFFIYVTHRTTRLFGSRGLLGYGRAVFFLRTAMPPLPAGPKSKLSH